MKVNPNRILFWNPHKLNIKSDQITLGDWQDIGEESEFHLLCKAAGNRPQGIEVTKANRVYVARCVAKGWLRYGEGYAELTEAGRMQLGIA